MGTHFFRDSDWTDAKYNHGFSFMIHETDMPEFLKYIRNITEHRPFTGGGSKSKRGEEVGQPESVSSVKNSSFPVTIPKAILIPDGPIRFGSLGDGDAFIHKLLEEKHIKTKEELRARLQDSQTLQPQQQLLGSAEDDIHIMT